MVENEQPPIVHCMKAKTVSFNAGSLAHTVVSRIN